MAFKDIEYPMKDYRKVIYYIGWTAALGIVFWLALLISFFSDKKRGKFFSPNAHRIIYIFGYIQAAAIIGTLAFGIKPIDFSFLLFK